MPRAIQLADKPSVDAIVETLVYLYTESRRLTKGLARQYGLTGPQLTVVKLLETLDPLSLSSLSDRIKARNSTVTGIIDRMERDGLVRRERSEADRRIVLIRLTRKGRKLAESIEVEPLALFRQALEDLPEKDLKELFRILTQFQGQVRDALAGEQAPAGKAERAKGAPQ